LSERVSLESWLENLPAAKAMMTRRDRMVRVTNSFILSGEVGRASYREWRVSIQLQLSYKTVAGITILTDMFARWKTWKRRSFNKRLSR